MALHIAGGRDKFLQWDVVGERKVLFLSLEMATVGIKEFMVKIAGYYDNHTILSKNFHIAPLDDNIALDRIEGQQFLDNLIAEYKPDVLFIDSMQKVTQKELTDELSSKALLNYFDKVRKRHGIAIFAIHHDRKRPSEQAH